MTTVARPHLSIGDVAPADSPERTHPASVRALAPGEARRTPGDDIDTAHDVDTTHETVSGARLSISRLSSGATVVALAGEIDLCSVGTVERTVLATVAASGGRLVVIDLNRVCFLGARGVAALVAAGQRATRGGGVLRVVLDEVAPAARVLRWIGDAGPVFPTLSEALQTPRDATAPRRLPMDHH